MNQTFLVENTNQSLLWYSHSMNEGPPSGIAYLSPESKDAALSEVSAEERNQLDAQERRDFPPPSQIATLWKYLES
jgi:hypothetical protein